MRRVVLSFLFDTSDDALLVTVRKAEEYRVTSQKIMASTRIVAGSRFKMHKI